MSASRDTLNPKLNTANLQHRLELINYYKYRNGVEMANWPHFAMKRLINHTMRYKFNYAIKGFAAYLMYRDIAQYRHMKATSYLSYQ